MAVKIMLGINVKKENNHIVITWQLTKVEIPISDIEGISLDNTYAGKDKNRHSFCYDG